MQLSCPLRGRKFTSNFGKRTTRDSSEYFLLINEIEIEKQLQLQFGGDTAALQGTLTSVSQCLATSRYSRWVGVDGERVDGVCMEYGVVKQQINNNKQISKSINK
jgi:hypothetical protein